MERYTIEVCTSSRNGCPLNSQRLNDFEDLAGQLSSEDLHVEVRRVPCFSRCNMGNSVVLICPDNSYVNFNSDLEEGIESEIWGDDPISQIKNKILK